MSLEIKSDSISESKSSHWFKNWKVLLALGVIVVGAGVGLAVGLTLGLNHKIVNSEIKKIDLTSLEGLSLNVNSDTTEENALDNFIKANSNLSDLRAIVTDFKASDYDNEGSYVVTADSVGKYVGWVTVKIDKLVKTDLTSLEGLSLNVNSDTTEENALDNFIKANSNLSDLRAIVTDFKASDYDNEGSYVVTADSVGKYVGWVTVKIDKLVKRDLKDLDLITSMDSTLAAQNDETGQEALKLFIEENEIKYPDLQNYVMVSLWSGLDGKLVVGTDGIINNKYTGTITIQFDTNQLKLISNQVSSIIKKNTFEISRWGIAETIYELTFQINNLIESNSWWNGYSFKINSMSSEDGGWYQHYITWTISDGSDSLNLGSSLDININNILDKALNALLVNGDISFSYSYDDADMNLVLRDIKTHLKDALDTDYNEDDWSIKEDKPLTADVQFIHITYKNIYCITGTIDWH